MSYSQKHIIQRLILEIEINVGQTELQAVVWHNEVENWVRQTLLPNLEVTLNEILAFSDETLRIDTLELDLGEVEPKLLKGKLENKLRQLKSGMGVETIEKKGKAEVMHLTQSQKTIEAFLYFLKTGRLPWWATPVSIQEWETKILAAFSEIRQKPFQFSNTVVVQKRLAGHFSERFFNELTQRLFAHFYKQSLDFQVDFKVLLKATKLSSSKQRELVVAVKEIMLHFFGQELPPEQLPLYVINHLPKQELLLVTTAMAALSKTAWKSIEEKQITKLLNLIKEREIPAQVVEYQNSKFETGTANENEMENGIYINNAGLVLLHPFIELFFEELKVTENSTLKKAQRGVSLLQWLATGVQNTAEYELMLNKLLCGIPLEEPVIGTQKLTKREKQEAQHLLEAVVRHWEVLKNTSPAGLQENFLRRAGKLTQKNEGDWLLQVERKSIDILLDHLPWSISMVKLPWMPQMLWVEWQ